ncbi:MAG: PAS domain-containing protein [Deltaproteobacteria bacterium]|nr:PAS domain-containing protein [Deltaproteobacteria bacterium]
MPETPSPDGALLLQSIVENLPDMIFVKDAAELRFVRFNRAGEQLLGFAQDDMLGRNDYDFFPREQADFFTRKDREVLQGNEVVDIPEEPIHTGAHGLRWLHTRKIPIRDADGHARYLLGISRDITELRDARVALQEREAQFRHVLERFPGIVWIADAEQRLTWIGGAGAMRLVIATDMANGRHVAEVLVAAVDVNLGAVHREALSGAAGTFSFSLGDREFEARVDRLGDGAVMGVALDVTERRRLEAQQVEARLQRAQRMEALGALAGGIAHDFNNLLVGMVGNASLALLKLPDGAAARPDIERLLAAAERAADLTRQMLAYSGKGRFVVEPVDIGCLVRETVDLLRSSLPRRAQLGVHVLESLPPVDADATQVRQVVMNLLTNAGEALPEAGGDVQVHVSAVTVEPGAQEGNFGDEVVPGPYVCVEVADTGSGMDEATRRRMFDPFFTTKTNGHGLGLAAALGIVRGHHGAIRVYSEPGRGTTVRVLLPAGHAPATVESRPSIDAETVMVIDDEPAVRDFARAVLEFHGYHVLEAQDGREAVSLFGAHRDRVGLVLLDLTMPGMDGEETFHELRALKPSVRVLLSSGYDEQQATSRFTGLGLAGFLRKPYRAEQLMAQVRERLGKR